jgi:RNA-dependent RNA polymerase
MSQRVQARIDKTLMTGIESPLSGRHYEFMAYSSSQLREGSCWFFSSDNPSRTTVHDIVSWMGTHQISGRSSMR